ncbi:MAG: hypothetical protein ABI186_04880 [Candidatus Elarobacter sp.]
MDALPNSKRIAGALRFLAELAAVGAEFAASHAPDELTTRRRRSATPRRVRRSEANEAR